MTLCLSFSLTYPGNNESERADRRQWGREHVGGQDHWFLSLIKPSSCPWMPPTAGPDSVCLKWFSSNCILRCFCLWFWHTVLASLVAEMVKNLCAMQETRVQFLGCENTLERRMATISSMPAWRIPWTVHGHGLLGHSPQRVGHDWVTNTHFFGSKLLTYLTFSKSFKPVFLLCLSVRDCKIRSFPAF